MRTPPVKLRWLQYFAAVAEELHFGRAAASLHVSTPALSHQIRELENALGATLFDRTSRSVRLTPAGKALYAKVQPGLSLLAEGVDDVAGLAPNAPAPTLTIGFVSALAGGVIPAALRRFRAAWPKTRVRLEQLGSREQLQRLAAGTLDAGFYWQVGGELTATTELRYSEIGRTTLHVALPVEHRLGAEPALELSQLANEEWLTSADGSDSELRNGFVALCRDHGFTPRLRNEATWIGSLQALVGAGLGVCASPGPAIHAPALGVVLRPLIGCELGLVATHPAQRLPRTDRFIADVSAMMATLRQESAEQSGEGARVFGADGKEW